jgi:putative transposase
MESFNTILKKEEVNVNTYETFNEARLAIFEFIEGWYNNIFDFLMNDKF